MIDCDCPRCGSRNTKALAVLHQDGTRLSDYRRSGVFYYRTVGIHASRTRGRSQTLTAQSAAPPNNATLTPGVVVVVLIVGALVGGQIGFWVALGSLFAIAILPAFSAGRTTNARQHAWSSTFRCGRCGTVFAVIDETPESAQLPDLQSRLQHKAIPKQ